MLLHLSVYFLVFCFGKSFGVIYHLNETEYDRMPRLFELENYERCMEDPGGVYCVANLELYTDIENDLYTLIQEYTEHTLKHYNYTNIDRGVCVTQTCETFAKNAGLDITRDLKTVLEGCLNETIIKQYDLNARIGRMNCVSAKDKDELNLDFPDYMFAGVFIILIVFALVGSFCEIYLKDKNNENNQNKGISGKDLLLCFSIPRNYKSLTIGENNPRMNVFKSVHAFRTIVTFFTVFGHVVFIIAGGFTSDPHSFEKAYESPIQRIISSGTNIVQLFFCISGVLLAYLLQVAAETQRMTWTLIPKLTFMRWWRLTPSAAMVIAFSATWMRHLGGGPLWRALVTDGSSAQCRRYFWTHLLYYNNYVPEDTLCAIPTWYIAADMQLYIAGVIIHFVIRNRSLRFKMATLSGLLLLSMAAPALTVWWLDLDALALQTPELYRAFGGDDLHRLHVLGHNNLSAYIVGMATGYLVYYLQQNKIEYPKFKIGNIMCWCVMPMHIFLVYCGSLFYYDGERPSIALRMLFAGTNRAIVGFIVALWVLGTTLKFNGMSKAVMEWPGWVVPSRLTYGVYLFHHFFIEYASWIRTQLTPVSFYNVFFMSVGIFVVSYLVAVPFNLLIEAPTMKVVKLILSKETDKKIIFDTFPRWQPSSIKKAAYESPVKRITLSATNIIQVFFCISGILFTYLLQVDVETQRVTWMLIPKKTFLRWWRLTPSAAMVIAFSATWMRHFGGGPLWRALITDGTSAQCRRYFWAHILYYNNYVPEDTHCALPTWYIAADMQLYIAGLLIHFVIRNRSLRFKMATLSGLLLLSMAAPALTVWWLDLDAFALQTPELYRTLGDDNFRRLHVLGHNNLSAFIVGMATGYLVYYLQQNKIEYPKFKIGNIICWCVIPMYILLLYCGSLFYYDGERPSIALRMLFAGTNRAVVGFIAAFWVLGTALKFNGMSKAIMEWPGWVVPSRLTYSVYLFHHFFIEYATGIRTQLTPVSFYNAFFMAVGVFLVSYLVAVPFHLLIEAPTTKVVKLIFNKKTDKKIYK